MSEERRRERDVPRGHKPGDRRRADHPLLQFSRSMRDFRGGITELQRVAERLGKGGSRDPSLKVSRVSRVSRQQDSGPNFPYRASSSKSRQDKTISESQAGLRPRERHVPGRHSETRFGIERPRPFVGVSPRMPHEFASRKLSKLAQAADWHNVHTPEDLEAVRHLTEPGSSGTFEDLPRAARVAMIARAADVLQESGQHNKVVETLAAAVRAGRPEIAANFNPRKLEQILSRALGGRQNALRTVWTPEIERLVERYHFERKTERERLQDAGAAASSEAAVPQPAHAELPVPSGSVPSVVHNVKRQDLRSADHLLRRNDLLHLSSHAVERRRQLASQGTVPRREQDMPSPSYPEEREEISLPSVSTATRRPAGPASAPASQPNLSSGDKRRLEGTLTLVGTNGEAIGSATLDGSERNG